MIIDKILDRRDGKKYNPKDFYFDLLMYEDKRISAAMDSGTEDNVKRELARYIIENGYRLSIINYINSVNWIC